MPSPTADDDANSPVPGGIEQTTYLVYVDDSGNEDQDLLTALAIPAEVWAATLEKWKKFRQWVDRKFNIAPDIELHALELGTNSTSGRGVLANLRPEERNQIADSAFRTLTSTSELRVLTLHAPVAEGSGRLYAPLVDFLEEFCEFHRSHAIVWYDGTAPNLEQVTRSVHRQLPYTRWVLEDPRGYSSGESHLIQMVDFVAYSAHQAILNDRGVGSNNTYLRQKAYLTLLAGATSPGLVWPGGTDDDDFPAFTHKLGIRGYPPQNAR